MNNEIMNIYLIKIDRDSIKENPKYKHARIRSVKLKTSVLPDELKEGKDYFIYSHCKSSFEENYEIILTNYDKISEFINHSECYPFSTCDIEFHENILQKKYLYNYIEDIDIECSYCGKSLKKSDLIESDCIDEYGYESISFLTCPNCLAPDCVSFKYETLPDE